MLTLAAMLADLTSAANLANLTIEAGSAAAPFIANVVTILSGTPLTDQQRADMLSAETALSKRIDDDAGRPPPGG